MKRAEREMCVECARREVCVERVEFAKRVNSGTSVEREASSVRKGPHERSFVWVIEHDGDNVRCNPVIS